MAGCEGCIASAQMQQAQYHETLKNARAYAKENQKPVAIYKEGFQYAFIEADIAVRDHYPITEFVTQYSPDNPGGIH